jgi:hypothetical protein
MSLLPSNGARICAAAMQSLSQANPEQNPEFRPIATGMLDALVNAREQSQSAVFTDIDQGNGHTRDLRVSYKQRGLASAIVEGRADCDEGTYNAPLEYIFRPTTVLKTPAVVFPEDTIREYCSFWTDRETIRANQSIRDFRGSIQDFGIPRQFAQDIMQAIIPLRQAWNENVIVQALALLGDLPTYSTATEAGGLYVAEVVNANGSVNFAGVNAIQNWFQDMMTNGTPYMVGAGSLRNTLNALASGCCNDGGINMELVNQALKAFYYFDPYLGQIQGNPNAVLAWQPGALIMPTINYNKGSFGSVLDNVMNFTMLDPVNPLIEYDVQLREVGCGTGRGYSIVISTPHFDLLSDPADVYRVGDDFRGVTGLIGINARLVTPTP